MAAHKKKQSKPAAFKPADFPCPVCGDSFHETTAAFDADKPLHGDMFRLKQKYIDMAWDRFDEVESTIGDNLVCPGCGNCYADSVTGRMRIG